MIDKTRCQLTPRNVHGIQVEIRPEAGSLLELKIRTGDYPAGIIGGVQSSEGEFRAVLNGGVLALSGRSESKVKLEPADDAIFVTFSGPGIDPSGPLELAIDDYRALVEHAISSRTAPRTAFI